MSLESLIGTDPESGKKWLESKKADILESIKRDTKSRQGFCSIRDIHNTIDRITQEDLENGKVGVPEKLTSDEVFDFIEGLERDGLIKESAPGEFTYTGNE